MTKRTEDDRFFFPCGGGTTRQHYRHRLCGAGEA